MGDNNKKRRKKTEEEIGFIVRVASPKSSKLYGFYPSMKKRIEGKGDGWSHAERKEIAKEIYQKWQKNAQKG